MGLKNFITTGVYVSIDSIQYNKNFRGLQFGITIYRDATKQVVYAQQNYEAVAHTKYRRVLGHSATPPKNPKSGDCWIIAPNGVDAWESRDGLLATWEAHDKSWHFWYWGVDEPFFYIPTKTYCVFEAAGHKILPLPADKNRDEEWWDSFFSPAVLFSPTTNIYKQIYLYLKQLPGFENVVDC